MVGWSRGPAIATIGRAGCIIINQNGTMEKFTGTGGTSGQVIHHQKPCARAERCVQGCAFGAYIVTDFLVRARVSRLNSMQAVLVILYQVRPNIKKSISPRVCSHITTEPTIQHNYLQLQQHIRRLASTKLRFAHHVDAQVQQPLPRITETASRLIGCRKS